MFLSPQCSWQPYSVTGAFDWTIALFRAFTQPLPDSLYSVCPNYNEQCHQPGQNLYLYSSIYLYLSTITVNQIGRAALSQLDYRDRFTHGIPVRIYQKPSRTGSIQHSVKLISYLCSRSKFFRRSALLAAIVQHFLSLALILFGSPLDSKVYILRCEGIRA